MKPFLKKITLWTSLLTIVGWIIVPVTPVHGANLDDLRRQQEELQNEIDAKNNEAAKKQSEADRLGNEVAGLDGDISTTESQINQTEGNIGIVRGNIEQVKNDISTKQKELDIQTDNFNKSVVELYRAGRQSNVEKILGSKDLSDALEKTTYLDSLQEQVYGFVQDIKKTKNELEEKKTGLENTNTELNGLLNQQESQRNALAAQRNSKENLKEGAEVAADDAATAAKQAERQLGSINDALRRALDSSGGSGAPVGYLEGKDIGTGTVVGYMGSTGNSSGAHLHFEVRTGGGGDGYVDFINASPVNPVTNCSGYGQDGGSLGYIMGFTHPLDQPYRVTCCYGGYSGHVGLDINHGPGVSGRPIHAAMGGKVIVHRYLNGWGNTVIISHGNGSYSLYGHML